MGERIRIRTSRRGRALEIDGTFASFVPHAGVATGSVWDALVAPLLALPPARRRAVLILGLGGGSAARIVRTIAPDARIVGVEFDRAVVAAARRHLELDALRIEVVCDDARAVLLRERRRFDLVIDDVFVGRGRAVHKPAWLPTPFLALAARRVAAGGVLVSNSIDEAPTVLRAMRALRPHVLELRIDGYDNRVFAGSTRPLGARVLRASIAAEGTLAPTLDRLALRGVASAPGAPRSPRAQPPRPRAPAR
jgi:spermidine synthase